MQKFENFGRSWPFARCYEVFRTCWQQGRRKQIFVSLGEIGAFYQKIVPRETVKDLVIEFDFFIYIPIGQNAYF